jgi:hypothetical protein
LGLQAHGRCIVQTIVACSYKNNRVTEHREKRDFLMRFQGPFSGQRSPGRRRHGCIDGTPFILQSVPIAVSCFAIDSIVKWPTGACRPNICALPHGYKWNYPPFRKGDGMKWSNSKMFSIFVSTPVSGAWLAVFVSRTRD